MLHFEPRLRYVTILGLWISFVFALELAKELIAQKDSEIGVLVEKLRSAEQANADLVAGSQVAKDEACQLRQDFDSQRQELQQCENRLQETQSELTTEKEARAAAETRLEKIETSLRSDKK